MVRAGSIQRTYKLLMLVLALMLLSAGCGDSDGDDGSGGNHGGNEERVEFEPAEIGELSQGDEVDFDVKWRPETLRVDEALVVEELEDLAPADGIYRVRAGSPLLEGVDVGSIVVWPQVGIFDIQSLEEVGEKVEIGVEWALLSDAMSSGEIIFRHDLRADENDPGRVFGARPKFEGDETAGGQYPLTIDQALDSENPLRVYQTPLFFEDPDWEFSKEGASVYATDSSASMQMIGPEIKVTFTSNVAGTKVSLGGSIKAKSVTGFIRLEEDEKFPVVRIDFHDLEFTVSGKLEVEGAKGAANVVPPAQLVLPFSLGPVPAYVAIGTDIEIESTIGSGETLLSAGATFKSSGSLSLARNPDGTFGAESTIGRFKTDSLEFKLDTSVTAGIAMRFSAPRLAFGIGRPGMAKMEVFGKKRVEMVFNTVLDPTQRGSYCAKINTSAADFVGGGIAFLGWSRQREVQTSFKEGEAALEGSSCK